MTEDTLQFAISLPPEWADVDLLDPGIADGMPSELAQALAFAAKGTDQARMLMVRSLVAVTEAREPLAAGLSVALAGPGTPVATAPLRAEEFAGSEVSAISLPVGKGLRVRDFFATTVGDLPVEGLRVQYLVHTEHGLLTVTFTTEQAAETEDWEGLFDAMAQSARLLA